MLRILRAIAALSLLLHGSVHAAPDPARLEAAAALLDTTRMPALIRYEMTHVKNAAPETQELLQYVNDHLSDHEIIQAIAPGYAEYLTTADAQQMIAYYRSASGIKRTNSRMAEYGIVSGNAKPAFSNAELAEYRRIESLPSARALNAASAELGASYGAIIRRWCAETYAKLRGKAIINVENIISKGAAIESTGLPGMDKRVATIAANIAEIRTMQQDIKSYNLAGIIEADNLATAEGIAESRRTLARYRMHVKRFQANMATIAQTYRELLGEQEGKELVKPLQDGLATITGLHQATLDTLTQVLDFADSRKGQLTVADGKLILQDEADLPILQSMFAKLRAAGVGARALNAQTR